MAGESIPRAILRFTGWWLAFFAAYMLFSETASTPEFGAAALCGLLGAIAVTRLRRNTRRRFALRPRWVLRLAFTQVFAAFRDCGPLLRALFRSRPAREAGIGTTMAIPFDGEAGRRPAEAAGRRALVTTSMCFTPNTVVIGLEMEPGHLLLHQLAPTPRPPGDGDPIWPV